MRTTERSLSKLRSATILRSNNEIGTVRINLYGYAAFFVRHLAHIPIPIKFIEPGLRAQLVSANDIGGCAY